MSEPNLLGDLRTLDAVTPKDDARRRTIVARAWHAAFVAACDADVMEDPAGIMRRGALHKQLIDRLTSVDDPALIRVARRLASLHAWRLYADYVLETPIPPGQETTCVNDAAEVIAVVEGRRRRRAFFDTLDVTLVDLRLTATDIMEPDTRLPLLRQMVEIHLARDNGDEAREAAGYMEGAGPIGEQARALALTVIAGRLRSIGEDYAARRDLADAVRLAHGVSRDGAEEPGSVLRDMIGLLVAIDAADYAREVAEEIADDTMRKEASALIDDAEVPDLEKGVGEPGLDHVRSEIEGIESLAVRYSLSEPLARALIAVGDGGTIELSIAESLAAADAEPDAAKRAIHLLDASWLMALESTPIT